MKKELLHFSKDFLANSVSDAVAVGVIDFKKKNYSCFQLEADGSLLDGEECDLYFDYASLTKPLTNAFSFIAQDIKDKNLEMLLNHRSGIPAWGLLSKTTWKDYLQEFTIKESETLYSDYGALRFMLEFEKHTGKKLEEIYSQNLDEKIIFWKNLKDERLLQYGFYKGEANYGLVHDPNALNLDCFTSHAGLFGTIDGLCRTLLSFDKKYQLLSKHSVKSEHRFRLGFDTVENPEQTLAGSGCSTNTFGHLGFSGTSFWIDPTREIGHIIFSNATKYHWYDKKELNKLRKKIGEFVWKNSTLK